MSLQHSEARRDRLREVASADLPPPSPAALTGQAGKHAARDRRRAAAQRLADEVAEARALGVDVVVRPTLDPSWTAAEDAVVVALFPDYGRMTERLPSRTRGAIVCRADRLGLVPKVKRWTPAEVATLQRLWAKATPAELVAALPRWTMTNIGDKGRHLGLAPRGRAPLQLTGDPLCDAVRDRCRVLGITMAELDRLARSGTYFAGREWRGKAGHRGAPLHRAVRALGGVLRVDFPD